MAGSFSGRITWTEDPIVFQKQCKALLAAELSDPNVEVRGTVGQLQNGIDLRGRRLKVGRNHWVGGQCKLKIKGEKLDLDEVRRDAEAALTIEPPLCEFIVLTNAYNDVKAQDFAAKFTAEQDAIGRDFKVTIWSAEEITERAENHPDVFRLFFPDALPQMKELLQGAERIEATVTETHALITDSNRSITLQIGQLLARVKGGDDDGGLTSALDREITAYRDAANAGSPRRSLLSLQNLLKELPDTADAHIRFRAIANIAACYLHLGDMVSAGARYIEAYEVEPEITRAKSLRVLGYICMGLYQEGFQWAKAVIEGGDVESELFVYLYAAAKLDGAIPDPCDLVPLRFADEPKVVAARIDFLRGRGDIGWRVLARTESERFPHEQELTDLKRDAALSDVVDAVGIASDRMLTGDQRSTLEEAAEHLRRRWNDAVRADGGLQADDIVVCLNLVTVYRLLQMFDDARRILLDALEGRPDDQQLLSAQLTVAMESDDYRLAEQSIGLLPSTRDTLMAQLVILTNESRWMELSDAIDQSTLQLPAGDDLTVQVLKLVARAKLGDHVGLKEVGMRLALSSASVSVPTQLYEAARTIGDSKWASELYALALTRLDDLDSASRLMLSTVAEHESDWASIITILHGHIEASRDTEDLRRLARAFVNSPPRASTPTFLASLPADIIGMPYYAQVIAGIYFNMGSLELAESHFQSALAGDPSSAMAHVGLLQTYRRLDRLDLLESHLKSLRVERIRGPAIQRMILAQMLIASGSVVDGFALAYSVTRANLGDAAVVKGYIGCILGLGHGASVLAETEEVRLGSSVVLERDDGSARHVVVIDQPRVGLPEPDVMAPEHVTSQALLGKNVGDEVITSPDLGTPQRWKIVRVRPKYLALWDEIRETFQVRFPDVPGFKQFTLEDNNLAPMLEVIQKKAEFGDRVADMYQTQPVPLVSLASAVGVPSVDFALSLATDDVAIRTCLGNEPERVRGVAAAESAKEAGVVLDTIAAWTAAILGILPALRKLASKVAVTQSTLDELQAWRDEPKFAGSPGPRLSVSYRDGDFFRAEITEDELRERHETISRAIEQIRTTSVILPGLVPDDVQELERVLLQDFGGGHDLDALFAADREGMVLVSEDLRLRTLAEESRQVPSTWIQPLLIVLRNGKQLSNVEYAEAISELAALRHEVVAVASSDLLNLALSDSTNSLRQFIALSKQVSGPGSEFSSHERVIAETIVGLYRELPFAKAQRYIGAMLERLVVLHGRAGRRPGEFAEWLMTRKFPDEVLEYFRRWARGHFIPFE